MVLEFRFKYLSKNKTLGKFLDFAAKKSECEYKIVQKLDFVYLYVKCSEKSLGEFSNSLSKYLPMSIFYYDIVINTLPDFPNVQAMSLEQDNLKPSDIYLDFGYNNLSNFSIAFKNKFGFNPSEASS